MIKTFLKLMLCSIALPVCAQKSTVKDSLNLNLERFTKNSPTGWQEFGQGTYFVKADSLIKQSGNYSVSIENVSESGFKALAIDLPKNYDGKMIQLSGYIKTENVKDGFAGLWMRIDPEIAFDNMAEREITGTTDWQKYEVTLNLDPKKTEKIVIGGLLVGTGKMWLDNLSVSIDGKELDNPLLTTFKRELLPAEKDKAFDNGSQISLANLNETQLTNLEFMGHVWGFLKYHHPEIAKGNFNWDYELFRILPAYLKVKNNEERDQLLIDWIYKLGTVSVCKSCNVNTENIYIKPDHSWVEKFNVQKALKDKINYIFNNRNQDKNFYVDLAPNVQNPIFNENDYKNMTYPDDGFRLLSLYRYWNMVNYFFPNKYITDKKWNDVLKEHLPKFINAKNELEYEVAALHLIGEVNDTHANLWGGGDKIMEKRGANYPPFKVTFIDSKLVVADYYNPEHQSKAQVKVGDVITHINNIAVTDIINKETINYPASNNAARLRDIAENILRSPNNKIAIKYLGDNGTKDVEIPLFDRKVLNYYYWYKVNKDEKPYKLLNKNIGYVTLANIQSEDIAEIKKMFKNTKAIIIDIRNYPSYFVPFELGSYFMEKPTPFVTFTKGAVNTPGAFYFMEGPKIEPDGNNYQGKLAVLVNENTQSSAEYTSMAFKATPNCVIIGSTTAGADGNVSRILLPGGLSTMISGIGIYYPNKVNTQRAGIVPDVVVNPTIEGIKKGKDEVLEKALEILKK